jgi:hypothetical protein
MADVNSGEWERVQKSAKHKYAWSPDAELLERFSRLPYPKRESAQADRSRSRATTSKHKSRSNNRDFLFVRCLGLPASRRPW